MTHMTRSAETPGLLQYQAELANKRGVDVGRIATEYTVPKPPESTLPQTDVGPTQGDSTTQPLIKPHLPKVELPQ